MLPKFSIVLPTRNRCNLLRRSLERLFLLEYPRDKIELLVVNDGSEDSTAKTLSDIEAPFAFRSWSVSPRGPAAARNVALREACGEVVLFVDDDILVSPDLLHVHARAHCADEFMVAFGPVRFAGADVETPLSRWMADDHEKTIAGYERGLVMPWQAALEANSSVRLRHLHHFGLYDERYYLLWENRELGIRLAKAGLRFLYLPDARAWHVVSKSADAIFESDAYWAGRSEVNLARQHPGAIPYTSLLSTLEAPSYLRPLKRLRWSVPGAWRLGSRLVSLAARGLQSETLQRLAWTQQFCANHVRGIRSLCPSITEFRRALSGAVPILMYHNIGHAPAGFPPSLVVSPQKFGTQLKFLRDEGYTAISLDEWLTWLEGEVALPPKPVILTFDDGFRGFYEFAFPALVSFCMRATVFVLAGCVGQTSDWISREFGCPPMPLMSKEHLRELAAAGISIGSHGLRHADYRSLDFSRLKAETKVSRQVIEDMIGRPVNWFCYPYGNVTEAARQSVIDAAYHGAVSTQPAMSDVRADRYALPRIMINGAESMFFFPARLRWAMNPFESILRRLSW